MTDPSQGAASQPNNVGSSPPGPTTPGAPSVPPSPAGFVPAPASGQGRLGEWMKRYTVLVEIGKLVLTFLVGATSGLIAASALLQAKVDEAVNKHLEPYERLAVALDLIRLDDYEGAVEYLREAITEAEAIGAPPKTLDLLYGQFLNAISNVDDPVPLKPDIAKIQGHLKNAVETGRDVDSLGWIDLHSGDADAAKQKFDRAKRLFDVKQDQKGGAEPAKGLLWAALAKGEVEEAVRYTKTMISRDPQQYSLQGQLDESRGWALNSWYRVEKGYYTNLDETVGSYQMKLQDELNKEQSKKATPAPDGK
jgi:tetratricopeptide (TPR) repeat protein